jgi:ribosome-binding ATPase YchF (GTP1/OBG family)
LIGEFQLLTTKPVLYVCNVEEKSAVTGQRPRGPCAGGGEENAEVIFVTAAIEAEIARPWRRPRSGRCSCRTSGCTNPA